MNRYFAHISHQGKIQYDAVPGSIGVLEALDKFMPIGQASQIGYDVDGSAVWRLIVRGAPVLGLWVIIDRRFVAVEGGPA